MTMGSFGLRIESTPQNLHNFNARRDLQCFGIRPGIGLGSVLCRHQDLDIQSAMRLIK